MAAAVTLLAKERGGPPLRFQVLFYPVTGANFETPSYMTNQNGYWPTFIYIYFYLPSTFIIITMMYMHSPF
jgi:acetyl esterase/lipase